MAHGIQLTRSAMRTTPHWHLSGFRLRVEATAAAAETPRDIFVFRRHPPDPVTGIVYDEFLTVASVPDLSEYPVGAPDSESGLPYFRADTVELDVRSSAQYDEVWTTLRDQAAALMAALDRSADLVEVEAVWLGDDTAVSDSI